MLLRNKAVGSLAHTVKKIEPPASMSRAKRTPGTKRLALL